MKIASLEDLKRELKERNKVWVTREGKVIPLKEMSTKHLINTINMLERQEYERRIFEENYLFGLTLEDIC